MAAVAVVIMRAAARVVVVVVVVAKARADTSALLTGWTADQTSAA